MQCISIGEAVSNMASTKSIPVWHHMSKRPLFPLCESCRTLPLLHPSPFSSLTLYAFFGIDMYE